LYTSREEAEVRQISGISKQYNLDFFKGMDKETGIQVPKKILENFIATILNNVFCISLKILFIIEERPIILS